MDGLNALAKELGVNMGFAFSTKSPKLFALRGGQAEHRDQEATGADRRREKGGGGSEQIRPADVIGAVEDPDGGA